MMRCALKSLQILCLFNASFFVQHACQFTFLSSFGIKQNKTKQNKKVSKHKIEYLRVSFVSF